MYLGLRGNTIRTLRGADDEGYSSVFGSMERRVWPPSNSPGECIESVRRFRCIRRTLCRGGRLECQLDEADFLIASIFHRPGGCAFVEPQEFSRAQQLVRAAARSRRDRRLIECNDQFGLSRIRDLDVLVRGD